MVGSPTIAVSRGENAALLLNPVQDELLLDPVQDVTYVTPLEAGPPVTLRRRTGVATGRRWRTRAAP